MSDAIPSVPAPWTLKGDVYLFSFWTSKAQASHLPSHAFSPLEAGGPVAGVGSAASKPVGGLSMIQVIRYTDSPVGPYDELIVIPGNFEWTKEDKEGRRTKKRNVRISRIYVSQRETCYNGRVNWNVPKHLAKFDWKTAADGAISVKVYPHDTTGDVTESQPSPSPFFQTSFRPLRFAPSFPVSTQWAHLLGVDTTLVLPPLPEGQGSRGELPGTDRWCSVLPEQWSRRSMLGWFDAEQRGDNGEVLGEFDNFWPGLGRWHLGLKMEDSTILFPEAEELQTPKSSL